jgi:hypothetical protein
MSLSIAEFLRVEEILVYRLLLNKFEADADTDTDALLLFVCLVEM